MESAPQNQTNATEPARSRVPSLLKTGNKTLDELLGGGIEFGLLYLLHSSTKRLSPLLQQLAVLAQLPDPDGGFNAARVLYVDAENTFDPYGMAEFARVHRLDPARTLGNITVVRAFQWRASVELLRENLISAPAKITTPLACIGGLNVLLPPFSDTTNSKLEQAFQDIPPIHDQVRGQATIIATLHTSSLTGAIPRKGKTPTQTAHVVVRVEDRPKVVEYLLERHPTRVFQKLLDFKDPAVLNPS